MGICRYHYAKCLPTINTMQPVCVTLSWYKCFYSSDKRNGSVNCCISNLANVSSVEENSEGINWVANDPFKPD